MEIRGYGQHRPWLSSAATVTLKAGDVYEAIIKEKVGDREAIVQLRGVDVRFRFEGEAPRSGRISVQITGQQGEVVEGKVVTPPSSSALSSFETPELRQAAEIVTAKQLPLTRETIASLRTFLTEGTGTVEQKLETIQVAASKKLDMTVAQLKAVHEALHGKPLSASLNEIVEAIDANFSFAPSTQQRSVSLAELRLQLQQEPDINRVMEQAKQYAEGSGNESLANAVREAVVFKESGNESFARRHIMQALVTAERKEAPTSDPAPANEALRLVRQQVEREPVVAKALSVVKGNEAVRQALGEALNEVEQLYRFGQPLSAKTRLLQALAEAENKEVSLNVEEKPALSLQQAVAEAKQIVRAARNIEEAVQQIKKQIMPLVRDVEAKMFIDIISRAEQMSQVAKEQLVRAVQTLRQQAAAATTTNEQNVQREQLLMALAQLEGQNRNVHGVVQQAIKVIQREADMKVALETVQTETIPALNKHHDAQQEVATALAKAQQLSEEGREIAARKRCCRH